MIVDSVDCGGMRDVKLARFNDAADLASVVGYGKYARGRNRDSPAQWAGGTLDYFYDAAKKGDVSFARRAEKWVDKFANLAIQDFHREMEYNAQFGVVDYQAAQAGNPVCLFGPSEDLSDKSPVQIYIDTWTSSTVPQSAMERRGCAVLALTIALSVYRPVRVKIVSGLGHMPSRTNAILVMDVPTVPMDLSMASWVLGSPTVFRHGYLSAIYEVARSSARCGIPPLTNSKWQDNDMANWLAEREGVKDVVSLGKMYGRSEWDSDAYCLQWIEKQLERFAT